ncbi:MAG: hypothetical protein AAFR71_16380 [Pseudomonadota bacterium]
MILEAEKQEPSNVSDFGRVETTLRKLKSYGPSSFASLTSVDGSYVQVAGGRVTCILEYRATNSNALSRAYLAEKRSPFEGIQTLVCGAGHIKMMPDEILFIDDVIPVFEAFYMGASFPEVVLWREVLSVED